MLSPSHAPSHPSHAPIWDERIFQTSLSHYSQHHDYASYERILVECLYPLSRAIARAHRNQATLALTVDDLEQIGVIRAIRALGNYVPSHGSGHSYFSRVIDRAFRPHTKREGRYAACLRTLQSL